MIDAHDGCLQFFQGRYYLYGTAYGKSAGYSIHNRFRVYSSPDLEHWRFEGELLKSPPDGVYYRPYVAFNPRTRKYVLYYNWFPRLFAGQTGVAVSDTPVGPFTIVHTKVNLSRAADRPSGSFRGLPISGVGDGSLFVDDDGTGYFIYSAGADHAVGIDRLTPGFLGSTGESSGVLAKGCEAPAMFRRGSRYYVLFDSTCCFCAAGSGARVYVASKPLGPYAELQNMNRDASGRPIVAAQQTFVAKRVISGWRIVGDPGQTARKVMIFNTGALPCSSPPMGVSCQFRMLRNGRFRFNWANKPQSAKTSIDGLKRKIRIR